MLSRISELSLSIPDFQALLDKVLPLVADTLGVEYCGVLKLLPDGNFLFEAGVGWNSKNIGKIINRDSASRAGYTEPAYPAKRAGKKEFHQDNGP